MSFRLDAARRDPARSLRRTAVARIDKALAEIKTHGADASAHELRKRVKELRGLLRLIRPGFADYRAVNDRLGVAATALSPARDAEVMLATLDALTAGLRSPAHFASLRAYLLDELTARRAENGASAIKDYRATLRALRDEVKDWKIKGRGDAVIWQGLSASWKQAQKRMIRAQTSMRNDFAAEPFHEWRKPVKHHWYQARLLSGIWPDAMAAHITQVDALGETLGEHNDLDVLIRYLRACARPRDEAALAVLEGHVMTARRRLANSAMSTGLRLLGEPPEALVARWQGWWAVWHQET